MFLLYFSTAIALNIIIKKYCEIGKCGMEGVWLVLAVAACSGQDGQTS